MNQNSGLVLELQRACIDNQRSITDILRMANMIAIKLELPEAKEWIDLELNGYKGNHLPPYRITTGQVKALNPVHGLVPANFTNPEVEDLINNVYVGDSVEHLIELTRDDGEITYRFEAKMETHLLEQQGYPQMRPFKVIGTSQIAGILNSIQNRVLDWALELERNGITGENMSFSKEEKAKAAEIQVNVQGDFQGMVGQQGGTASQSFNNLKIEAGNFDSLANHLREHKVHDVDIAELEQAVKDDGAPDNPQKFGPKVSAWIGKMTTKAASGSWDVSVGASGNLLSDALMKFFGGG